MAKGKKKLARNKKRQDAIVAEVQQQRAERQAQVRTLGVEVASAADSPAGAPGSLFVIDRALQGAERPYADAPKRSRRAAKRAAPLRSEAILVPNRHIVPLGNPKGDTLPRAQLAQRAGKKGTAAKNAYAATHEDRKVKRLQAGAGARAATQADRPTTSQLEDAEHGRGYDVWGAATTSAVTSDVPKYMAQRSTSGMIPGVKRKATHGVAQQQLIPVVETPDPGQSYNPDYGQHQALLGKAVGHITAEEAEVAELKRRFPNGVSTLVTFANTGGHAEIRQPDDMIDAAHVEHGGQMLLPAGGTAVVVARDGESESDDEADEHEPASMKVAELKAALAERGLDATGKKAELAARLAMALAAAKPAGKVGLNKGKLTKPERARRERHKQEQQRTAAAKVERRRRGELDTVISLSNKLAKQERQAVRESADKQKRVVAAEQQGPPRLGPNLFKEPMPDVQLSENQSGSLTTMKVEGSLLKDRYKSMQKRAVVEPRSKIKHKRRYQLKAFNLK